jgi:hypothetical protein
MANTFNNVETVDVVNVPAGNILTTSEDPTEPPTATQHFLETPGLITVKHVPFGEDPSRDIGSNIDLASITPFKGVATPGYPFFIPGEIGWTTLPAQRATVVPGRTVVCMTRRMPITVVT